ncbi:MAG: hypothetical protein Q4B67_06180 [Eubacteriales bacterium]|nr:hypothetical protein [Eubacteriales bacterium]
MLDIHALRATITALGRLIAFTIGPMMPNRDISSKNFILSLAISLCD